MAKRRKVQCMNSGFKLFLLFFIAASLSGQSKQDWQIQKESCVTALSTFSANPDTVKAPDIPRDLNGVTLEYSKSGCYGRCPAFTLRIQKDIATWEGHAYVKAKGKKHRKISSEKLAAFIRSWVDGKLYAMRDEYCNPRCPDGTVTIITDVQESSITLETPSLTKTISECFTTIDGKAQNPKPPEEYFRVSRELTQFAKEQGWL